MKQIIVGFSLLALMGLGVGTLVQENQAHPVSAPEILSPDSAPDHAYGHVVIHTYDERKQPIDIAFDRIPHRVITNQKGSLETIFALGAGQSVVAASVSNKYMDGFDPKYTANAKLPPIIRHEFDRETIVMYEPDFIVGWGSTFSKGALINTTFWRERNIPTYIMASSNRVKKNAEVEDECRFILDMAEIFNQRALGESYVREIRTQIREVCGRAREVGEHPTVMVLQYNTPAYIFNYERQWLVGDMVERLGGELVSGEEHTVNKEEILWCNPEIIFVMCTDERDRSYYEDMVRNDIALNSLDAVHHQRIYGLPFTYVYAPGIRVLDGIRYMADCMYPDLHAAPK